LYSGPFVFSFEWILRSLKWPLLSASRSRRGFGRLRLQLRCAAPLFADHRLSCVGFALTKQVFGLFWGRRRQFCPLKLALFLCDAAIAPFLRALMCRHLGNNC
jgi:hypothetical protein